MMKIGYFIIIAVNLKDTLDHIVLLLKTITNRSQCLQGTIILAHAANRMFGKGNLRDGMVFMSL